MTISTQVSVIVLTWNGADLLRDALASLAGQTFRDFEIIVVDNGSTDHTPHVLRDFPNVRVVRFESNRGFAMGANAGVRVAAGRYIALLNNDARALPGWLAALVDALHADPQLGSCASKMLQFNRPELIDAAGDQLGVFASQIGHGRTDGSEFQQPYHVISACAGAALYRREAIENVGLFDERYFAYLEDVDLGVRLQLAGYKCRFVPDAVVLHHGSASARRIPGMKFRLLMRNSMYLFFQYMPLRRLLWSPLVLAWPILCGLADRQPVAIVLRVYAEVYKALPDIVRIRREWRSRRTITTRAFLELLAPPLTVQGRSPDALPVTAAAPRTLAPIGDT